MRNTDGAFFKRCPSMQTLYNVCRPPYGLSTSKVLYAIQILPVLISNSGNAVPPMQTLLVLYYAAVLRIQDVYPRSRI
jgi:hypothetical protein